MERQYRRPKLASAAALGHVEKGVRFDLLDQERNAGSKVLVPSIAIIGIRQEKAEVDHPHALGYRVNQRLSLAIQSLHVHGYYIGWKSINIYGIGIHGWMD
ncbi:unnamed protein product [Linum trigynum]|uniref:Uncharacterized protein n=1 Tax=Linum trigynum TaxID=586398 RepID=A0AAV2F7B7_9ROSI